MYKIKMFDKKHGMRVIASWEFTGWVMMNMRSQLKEYDSVSVEHLVFESLEDINYFKLIFGDKYEIEVIDYAECEKKENIA